MTGAAAFDPVDLGTRRAADGAEESLQATCARPGCTELFLRSGKPGRPAQFHDENCRRQSHAEERRLRGRVSHHENQLSQLRRQLAAYSPEAANVETDDDSISFVELRLAREAVARAQGRAEALVAGVDRGTDAFLELLDAVAPVVAKR